ncbi:ubiquitin-specific protease ubp15, partial [Marasmius sp. AFHP31]
MSIYLARDPPEVKSGNQTSDSHFALVVSLHDDPEVYVTTHGYHKFTENDPDSGFTYFDAKKRLLDHQVVVSEAPLQVSVFLRVFEETETGHLVPKKGKLGALSDDKPLSTRPVEQLLSVKDTTAFLAKHMEDPYLDFKSSTLRIERWSKVSKDSIESESFDCGGYK